MLPRGMTVQVGRVEELGEAAGDDFELKVASWQVGKGGAGGAGVGSATTHQERSCHDHVV